MSKIVVIGNGKMAIDCIKIMLERPAAELRLAVYDPKYAAPAARVSKLCEDRGIPAVGRRNPNHPEVVERATAIGADIIFNINSLRILKEKLLAVPRVGIINFHNAPLPLYGGVNIPSWAIINGETEHGVTWHFVDEGIDTGDIVAQRRFEISNRETAISLNFKCIVEGIQLFEETIDDLLSGNYERRPQAGESSYYSLKDVPNDGYVDFSWSFEKLDRFVRGLDFRPFENTFTYPRVRCGDGEFIVNSLSRRDASMSGRAPGTLVTVEPGRLEVAIGDGVVGIDEAMDAEGEEIELDRLVERYGLRAGDRLGG